MFIVTSSQYLLQIFIFINVDYINVFVLFIIYKKIKFLFVVL